MNKPVKLLASVSVLAFASVGLYYAWLAPRKPGVVDANPPRQTQAGARVSSGGTVAPNEAARAIPANSVPTQVPVERAVPGTGNAAVATGPATPPGFRPADQPMQPLPERLPGFEPVKTASAPATAAPVTGQPAATPAATPSAVPAAAPVTRSVAGAPAAAPTPAPSPVPATPASTGTRPAAAPPALTTATPAPAPKPAAAKPTTYTVKSGDSLSSIWRGLTGSDRGWESLQAANPGVDPSRLKIGQVLKVPDLASNGGATRPPAAAASTTLSTGGVAASGAAASASSYTVASGDTLSAISTKVYGTSKHWKEIYEANKDAIGSDPANLKVGQVLRMPSKGAASKTSSAKTSASSTESKPAPNPAPAPAPSSRPAPPPGTIGAPAPAPSVSPAGTPAPR